MVSIYILLISLHQSKVCLSGWIDPGSHRWQPQWSETFIGFVLKEIMLPDFLYPYTPVVYCGCQLWMRAMQNISSMCQILMLHPVVVCHGIMSRKCDICGIDDSVLHTTCTCIENYATVFSGLLGWKEHYTLDLMMFLSRLEIIWWFKFCLYW